MKLSLFCLAILTATTALHATDHSATNTPGAIPWSQIGAKAGADYHGDGLAVTPTDSGARLHCVFQRLEAEATPEGLWLTSTVTNSPPDRFRVTAMAVGRKAPNTTGTAGLLHNGMNRNSSPSPGGPRCEKRTALLGQPTGGGLGKPLGWGEGEPYLKMNFASWDEKPNTRLSATGDVTISNQTVRFTRPGLTEEYTATMDGIRQDFIVSSAPEIREASWSAPALWRFSTSPDTTSELIVQLSVTGAKVEPAPGGAHLLLENSHRKIAYTRLRVTDATGKELPARIEVCPVGDEVTSLKSSELIFGNLEELNFLTPASANPKLAIVINDADAVYPLRIDPTFSDANWISLAGLPGANGQINAETVDSSGDLYIGGQFTIVGSTFATNIAEWNGTSWSALNSGINGQVNALAISGGTLYAGGSFSTAGGVPATNIAQWNGIIWSPLGSGISGGISVSGNLAGVYALAWSSNTLYAGGLFSTAGGVSATNIAQWNGADWTALGPGLSASGVYSVPGEVRALALSGSILYAGGSFLLAGTNATDFIAQWNGTNWSALASGMNSQVLALAVSGGTLYAAGQFTTAGGIAADHVSQWNGTNWSALGSGMNVVTTSLAVSGGTLYAAGFFNIAQWNGTNWSYLGSVSGGAAPYVYALAVSGATLYAGGAFTSAEGNAANNIAQWNGINWSPPVSGFNGGVNALAVSGATLYAAGTFTTAGGITASNIAQWNGTNWSPLGSGLNGQVVTLAVSGGTLYAGGYFTNAATNLPSLIAQWDGANWSPLGSGVAGPYPSVLALAVSGSNLYVGGSFLSAGGGSAFGIAQWNGYSWSALGTGVQNGQWVYSLAVSGNTLYAGGDFTVMGGIAASNIAQWNGSNWSALGSGMNDSVYSLAVSGNTLYAGGDFTVAGGIAASNLAQWNGMNWSPLGLGVNKQVNALAISGSTLYAGGEFTNAGGASANYIAQWDGTDWSALGHGVNSQINALLVSASALYAGGEFTTAGTNVSIYVAEAILPASLSILTTDGNFGFTNSYFGFDISGPPGSNVVIQTSTNLQTWIPLQTNALNPSGLLYFSDTQSPANSQRFYNVVLP